MPVKNDREYRRIDLENIECRDDENGKIVEGYATVFGNEYLLYSLGDYEVRESFDRDSFAEADVSDVIMQYDHEGRVFARVSNGTLEIQPDEHGLHIRANLGGTDIGRELYDEIRGGYTNKMSIGFTVAKQNKTEDIKDAVKKGYSVAIDTISPEYRVVGDFRLAKYGSFLMENWYPLHDRLCGPQGTYMREYVLGNPSAEDILKSLKGQVPALMSRFFEL